MLQRVLVTLLAVLFVIPTANADEKALESALSAGPESLTRNATVMDWDGNVLKKGTNSWTCLPDIPENGGNDPWCVDASWQNLLDALMNNRAPSYDKVGIAYMLAGDAPISNIKPDGKKGDGDWVEGLTAHLMILVPDHTMFDNISTDPNNGGPWIMWPNTPYAHIMVPIDSYPQ